MIDKYTSVREVIAKIYRDLHLEDESRWEDMIEWIGEAMLHIGAFPQYFHKAECFKVENYRLAIPCDFYKLVGIEYKGVNMKKLTGNYDTAFRNENSKNLKSSHHYGYTINNAYFNFNFEEGEVDLAYIAVPMDAEGFPLVPDDVSYREAMLRYVVMKLKYPEHVMGTINPNTWNTIVNDWHVYCGQARGKANMPNADQMETIKNMWNRLKPMMNEHKNFFNNFGDTERITQ